MSAQAVVPTYLVKGDDASLVAQEVRSLLAEVVGDQDHALVVEEIGGGSGEELSVGAVVDACLTPPSSWTAASSSSGRRDGCVTADAPRLVSVIEDPLPSTVLILVGGGGTVPAPVVKAVERVGSGDRRHHDQGGGAQGVAPRAPPWRARQARARPLPTCWPTTSARTSAGSRGCSAP